MRLAVIGLGAIGMGVAHSLVRAGFETWGIDLRAPQRAALAAAGAAGTAGSAAELGAAAEGLDAAILCLVNAEQCEAVLFGEGGLAARLPAGATAVICSTAAPDRVAALAARLAARGVATLDAPVSGGAARAAEGKLTIMLSGPPEAVARLRPALDAMAERIYDLGPEAGQAATVKVAHQLLAGVHIAAAAEAMALATRAGIAPEVMYDVVTHSAGNSWMFGDRMRRLIDGDTAPRSTIDIFVKDLGLVSDLGTRAGQELPLARTALDLFRQVSAAGGGALDDSQVIRALGGLARAEAAE